MFGRGLGDTYAVFLLPLEREFGWTRSQVASVYSIYLLVNGFTAALVGLAFDRLGPRWVYGAGMACLGAGFFLAGGLANLWQFYLFIGMMVGVAVSFNGMVPASALLSRWFPARLSTAIGIAYSATGFGTLLFVPLAQHRLRRARALRRGHARGRTRRERRYGRRVRHRGRAQHVFLQHATAGPRRLHVFRA